MIRAGFIGTGGISKAHLDVLQTCKNVEVAALCDVNAENLKERINAYGGKGYADFRQMLKECELDAVWICTPPEVRREPLTACAEHGLPVFCEKPVAKDVQIGEEIDGQLTQLNARVQVGYVFRSIPAVQKLREVLRDDAIHAVQSSYICDVSLSGGLRPWFYDKELSGGPLVDQATHNFDLLRLLFGEIDTARGFSCNPRKKKEPGYTIDEVIAATFAFESGTLGCHIHSWLGDTWRNVIVMSGEKGLYSIDLNLGKVTTQRGSETTVYQQENKRIFVYENEMFLRQVESGDWSRNPSDFSDGLQTLKVTFALNDAVG